MVKRKYKYGLRDIFEDYFWIVGLSLIIGGLLKLSENSSPWTLILMGVLFAGVASFVKGGARK